MTKRLIGNNNFLFSLVIIGTFISGFNTHAVTALRIPERKTPPNPDCREIVSDQSKIIPSEVRDITSVASQSVPTKPTDTPLFEVSNAMASAMNYKLNKCFYLEELKSLFIPPTDKKLKPNHEAKLKLFEQAQISERDIQEIENGFLEDCKWIKDKLVSNLSLKKEDLDNAKRTFLDSPLEFQKQIGHLLFRHFKTNQNNYDKFLTEFHIHETELSASNQRFASEVLLSLKNLKADTLLYHPSQNPAVQRNWYEIAGKLLLGLGELGREDLIWEDIEKKNSKFTKDELATHLISNIRGALKKRGEKLEKDHQSAQDLQKQREKANITRIKLLYENAFYNKDSLSLSKINVILDSIKNLTLIKEFNFKKIIKIQMNLKIDTPQDIESVKKQIEEVLTSIESQFVTPENKNESKE